MKWDGTERRKKASDHDTLICLVQILDNHVANFNAHVEEDKVLAKEVRFSTKIIYMGLGALGIIELLMGFHK